MLSLSSNNSRTSFYNDTSPFLSGICGLILTSRAPSQGNAVADKNTRLICSLTTDPITRATQFHDLHHVNAHTLRLLFKITREQARQIVKNCPGCVTLLPLPHLGVNPRGLLPGEVWQMDVTHIPEFGHLKYAHVTIDTFSGFIFATLHSGEATKMS